MLPGALHASLTLLFVTSLTAGRPGTAGNVSGSGERWKTTAPLEGASTLRRATSERVSPVSLAAQHTYSPVSERCKSAQTHQIRPSSRQCLNWQKIEELKPPTVYSTPLPATNCQIKYWESGTGYGLCHCFGLTPTVEKFNSLQLIFHNLNNAFRQISKQNVNLSSASAPN